MARGKDSKESFDLFLHEWLKDSQNAAEFLNSLIKDEKHELFPLALRNVIKAQGGMTLFADLASVSRTTLYRTLSMQGNPDFRDIAALLKSMGLKLKIEADTLG